MVNSSAAPARPRSLSVRSPKLHFRWPNTRSILRGIRAGFDGVEIHGGYGYLPQQFLSPYTNRHEDRWGGTREKRHAFPLALLTAAQAAAREHASQPFAVGCCFTPEEASEPGLSMDDAVLYTRRESHLSKAGAPMS